jgi:hypothetical protein
MITKSSTGKLNFSEKDNLPLESLLPPLNFKDRYDPDLVDSYEVDKMRYLKLKEKMIK